MQSRSICVVTGTRADYGLLYWLMKEIQEDPLLDLQLIVTGMHLTSEFGMTSRVIEEDGFRIDARVEMLLSSDSSVGVSKSIGLGIIGFADVFERLRPDVVVVLGDRFEILAAAQAALVAKIPIAHIHGGESTEGVIDEAIRHAVTKMAHLHFVSAYAYQNRVVQLGETPTSVYNVGAPGLDNIRRLRLLGKSELQQALQFDLSGSIFLVTYHPVTLQDSGEESTMISLLRSLDAFPTAKVIFTKPNADANNRTISRMIDAYAAEHPARVYVATSLGQLRYLSAMNCADVVIGNSSSGIIEAPFLHTPTVNIGNRQTGRLKSASVIDCEENTDSITYAIERALSPIFREVVSKTASLYGNGDTSRTIKEILKNTKLDRILNKRFHDLPVLN